jgi:hypothetical protein
VNGYAHRRIARILTLVLTSVWMGAVIAAGAAETPAMHCHGINMPCCPPSGGDSTSCSGAQCIEQVPQKNESRIVNPAPAPRVPIAVLDVRVRPSHVPVIELTSGLRYQSSVFRLKDDLRI